MPKHIFRDEENRTFELLPDGDYIVEVAKAELGISNGAKTRGSEQLELTLRSEPHGITLYETLIFHESVDWKIDNFIKCMNLCAVKGQDIELTPENILGVRGWITVGTEEYQGKKRNRIKVWITNKPKLPRNTPAIPRTEDDDVPF